MKDEFCSNWTEGREMIEELSNEMVEEVGGGADVFGQPGGLNVFDAIWDYFKRPAPADVSAEP